jgi:multidrug efflux pump subunit AcrB
MVSPGVFSLIGTRLEEGEVEVETLAGSHYISALVAMPPNSERTISGREFAREWKNAFGEPDELEALNFTGETNITGGEPLRLEVYHHDPSVARAAALSLGDQLREFSGLTSVDDGIRAGKPELKLELKSDGLHMGMTAADMAKQIRHRFHGAEAIRFVRGGNEVKVMLRLLEKERRRSDSLQEVLLRNPAGDLVPLTQVAEIIQTRSFTSLARRNGKRVYPVTADIMFGVSDDYVEDVLEEEILPALTSEYPGVSVNFGGEEEEIDESLNALGKGFLVVLGVLFLLLALHYNSYIQSILVLSVIPFSFIGAAWGHILLGYDLSIVSLLGVIATAGVVVNDSLVLVTTYNRNRACGMSHHGAIMDAACHRFRPILLTSLTTFFGMMPLLLETSEQAQFLIPAAVSISFGLAFGTLITLVLLPVLIYLFPRDHLN